jgi:hypothetical protein
MSFSVKKHQFVVKLLLPATNQETKTSPVSSVFPYKVDHNTKHKSNKNQSSF